MACGLSNMDFPWWSMHIDNSAGSCHEICHVRQFWGPQIEYPLRAHLVLFVELCISLTWNNSVGILPLGIFWHMIVCFLGVHRSNQIIGLRSLCAGSLPWPTRARERILCREQAKRRWWLARKFWQRVLDGNWSRFPHLWKHLWIYKLTDNFCWHTVLFCTVATMLMSSPVHSMEPVMGIFSILTFMQGICFVSTRLQFGPGFSQ